jgi:hypothetical protein
VGKKQVAIARHLAMQLEVNVMIINADYKCARPVEWLCVLATFVGLMKNLLPPRQSAEGKKGGKQEKRGHSIVCRKNDFSAFLLNQPS